MKAATHKQSRKQGRQPAKRVSRVHENRFEQKETERQLRRRAEQQQELYRLTDALNHADTVEAIHEAALNAILKALEVDRASILLFDSAGVMRFAAWRGLSDEYRAGVDGH